MSRRSRIILALCLGTGTVAALAQDADRVVMYRGPDEIRWVPGGGAEWPGEQMAVLAGDLHGPGGWTLRLKSPPGAEVAPHFHPMTENVTVLEGDFHLGIGDKLDKTKGTEFGPGGFFSAPAGVHLYGWTDGGTVIQVHSDKPIGRTLIHHPME